MKRREFVRSTVLAGGAAGLRRLPGQEKKTGEEVNSAIDNLPKQGIKSVASGKKAVCSSSHPIVTDMIIQVMKDGGNAIDAVIAGAILQATVEPLFTNHTGEVTLLYWDAKAKKAYQLESTGTLVPGLPPFSPIPSSEAMGPTVACIPGFMPAMGEMHRRFGTKKWSSLVEPSVRWAEDGHPVHSLEFALLERWGTLYTYLPEGRDLFTPNGFMPQVGQSFKNPALAKTLRRLAEEGPEYFTQGDWAKHFVQMANKLGWPIKHQHMTMIPPRWQEPLRYRHDGHEILQLSPPERTGIFTALVLGALSHLDLKSMGHYTRSAETLYYLAHALRWADWQVGFVNDPEIFDVPVETWLSDEYHKMAAEILKKSKPKIDLTGHVRLLSSQGEMFASGLAEAGAERVERGNASCELSIVDQEGNWVQLMNSLQSGGIPGAVVDGVPQCGSSATPHMRAGVGGWYAGGGRIREVIGSTIVLKDGRPCLSLGTPGYTEVMIPQILMSILDFDMDPYEASVAPRMMPLRDDYVLEIECRIPKSVVAGLARMGIKVTPMLPYNWHLGSFQMCWLDKKTGLLHSGADPRRAGKASGF